MCWQTHRSVKTEIGSANALDQDRYLTAYSNGDRLRRGYKIAHWAAPICRFAVKVVLTKAKILAMKVSRSFQTNTAKSVKGAR